MGSNWRKIDYKCDCGKNYGSCGETATFYEQYSRSTDITYLYHKNCDGNIELLFCLTDDAVKALITVLWGDPDKLELITSEEREQLKKL